MTNTILTESDVVKLVGDLVGAGTRVIAPVPAGPDWSETEYRPIERFEEAMLDGPLPRRSLKEFLRPPQPDERAARGPQVILGVRPCDAAGIETLGHVMTLDYRNELWRARRAATTIVTVACGRVEQSCFCGAVGVGPDSTRGADAILVPLELPSGPPRRSGASPSSCGAAWTCFSSTRSRSRVPPSSRGPTRARHRRAPRCAGLRAQ